MMKCPRCGCVLVVWFLGAYGLGHGATPDPRGVDDLTGPWQLLVDDFLIATRSNLIRTYHPFQKHAGNPVLAPSEPWEATITYIYGTVMPDETDTGYRMWYHTYRAEDPNNDGSNILYATSTDGLHWHKPNLGIRSWHGSTANNMIYNRPGTSGITSVMHTPWQPVPARRYAFMNYDSGGFWGAWSPDGIHTSDLPNNPVFTGGGDVGQFVWDPNTQRFLGYVKLNTDVNGLRRRSVGLTTTPSIESWPAASLILEVDAFDDRWVPPGTVQRTHLYGMSAFPYETMYLGLLWIFRATDVEGYYLGPVFAELVTSRDGVHWSRQEGDRTPILPLGPPGTWDTGQLYTARAPIIVNDAVWIYYGGCDKEHGQPTKTINCAIGLATLRKDGFASLDAGPVAGSLTTRTLAGVSGPLRVNYVTTGGGWLKVEVLDGDGNALPGYGEADCLPLQGDSVNQVVTWTDRTLLPTAPSGLRLRFIMQQASLYSFDAGPAVQVVAAPSIAQQPFDQVAVRGRSATFTTEATGTGPLVYQWFKDGIALSDGGHYAGSSSPVLTITAADEGDVALYACRVSNAFGGVASQEAGLRLLVAQFTGVGSLGAGGSTVSGITADGSVVCGASEGQAVIWSASQGMRSMGVPAGATTSSAAGVGLFNVNVVAAVNSNAAGFKAHRWNGNPAGTGAFTPLPRMDGVYEWTAAALGTDGSADLWIVGSTISGGDGNGRQAGRYRQSSGSTNSFSLPSQGHDHSDFHAVSDTGLFGGQYQYRGTAPTGGSRNAMKASGTSAASALNTLMGAPSTSYEAVVKAFSRSGLVLGGWSYYPGGGAFYHPVIWNNSTTPTAVPFIPGGDGDNFGEVLALNGNGTVAGGYSYHRNPDGPREAFLWNASQGTRQLKSLLAGDYGLDTPGWSLIEVKGMSADGSVLTGNGLRNGASEGWVVTLVAQVVSPPVIAEQPQPQHACLGGSAAFTVVADGQGGLQYQWQKNGIDLSDDQHYAGTTTPALSVPAVDDDDLGVYRCVVRNVGGNVTSNAVALSLRVTVAADLDCDGDVDGDDCEVFLGCVTGPQIGPPPAGCLKADLDDDQDVDQADFGLLQRCYSGDGVPVDPTCDN